MLSTTISKENHNLLLLRKYTRGIAIPRRYTIRFALSRTRPNTDRSLNTYALPHPPRAADKSKNSSEEYQFPSDRRHRNRWDWRVSLKASGPPRSAGQISRCQLMSPLAGIMGFSRTLCGNGPPQRGPAEEQKEKLLRPLRILYCRCTFLVGKICSEIKLDKECSIHAIRKR
ncbi:hypothetical protein ACFW04_000161 [Cataglyphis niger]